MAYLAGRTWGSTASEVAYAMWPDSPSWKSPKKPGVGARFAASALLNRLIGEGWVARYDTEPLTYNLTPLGVGAMKVEKNTRQKKAAQRIHQSRRPCGSTLGTAKRAWKEVTCPACLRHRQRGGSSTANRKSKTSRSRKG